MPESRGEHWPPEWYELQEQNELGVWVVVKTFRYAGAYGVATRRLSHTKVKARLVQCLVVGEKDGVT